MIHSRILPFIALFAGSVAAQVTGRVSGSVSDASGAAVPGADVSLSLAGGKAAIFKTSTTSDGLFTFSGVRAENYSLSVEAKGFVT